MSNEVKRFHKINTPAKWELLEILARDTGETIPKGKLLRHEGILYKTLKKHEVKAEFNPEITNYLYVKAIPENVIPEWVKPTGYENAYSTGDKVLYNGKIYVSKIEGNSQEPTKDEPYNRYWVEE